MKTILLLTVLLVGCPEYEISIKPARPQVTDKMVRDIQSSLRSGETLIQVNERVIVPQPIKPFLPPYYRLGN